MKHGFYLQGVPQVVGQGKDEMEMIQHIIVEVTPPTEKENGRFYLDKPPIIREIYLKTDVMEVLPSGTAITFELDTKLKTAADGKKYEKIVPVEIKAAKPTKVDK